MTPPVPDARDPLPRPNTTARDGDVRDVRDLRAQRDNRLDDTATFPAAQRGDAARPLDDDEARGVKATSAPVGALAGAAAGATAGLVTVSTGPIGFLVGAVVGAMAGTLGGWFGGKSVTEVRYDEEQDSHYRALYDGGTPSDRGFESARPAYQLGHIAAHNPDWVGRDFSVVEPELRRVWDGDLRTQHRFEWEAVRPYARDAYGHARSEGAGARRDLGVIGSAGSAVDPLELERARAGQSSIDAQSSGFIATRDQATGPSDPRPDPGSTGRAPGTGLGEHGETDANTAHRRDPELH